MIALRKRIARIFNGSRTRREYVRRRLRRLASREPSWDPRELESIAVSCFVRVQDAWLRRDFETLKFFLDSRLHSKWFATAADLRRQGILSHPVELREMTIVHFKNFRDDRRDEFTAAMSGSESGEDFEEFWTFRRQGTTWILADVTHSDQGSRFLGSDPYDENEPVIAA